MYLAGLSAPGRADVAGTLSDRWMLEGIESSRVRQHLENPIKRFDVVSRPAAP